MAQTAQRHELHEVGSHSGSGSTRSRLPNRAGVYTKVSSGVVVIAPKPDDLLDTAIKRVAFDLCRASGKFGPGKGREEALTSYDQVTRVAEVMLLDEIVAKIDAPEAADKYAPIVNAMCETILNERHAVITRARKNSATVSAEDVPI